MPCTIRPFRRFPVCCSVTDQVGDFEGHGTVSNCSRAGWSLSDTLPMRPGETLSLTITLPNEQRIGVPEAVVRWSRGEEFAVETRSMDPNTQTRLHHSVERLVEERATVSA